jgi:ribonuclease HI
MITTLDDYNNNTQINSSTIPLRLPLTTNIEVYFDGLCQPCNPGGTACYTFIVKDGENTIHSKFGVTVHNSTNNVAEYTAIIRALE